MKFEKVEIVRTGSGYRVTIDGEPYYCENMTELAEFLEDMNV